jgi:hypothetical protein
MTKYRCIICGYIYDPVEGDPDGGISPELLLRTFPIVGNAGMWSFKVRLRARMKPFRLPVFLPAFSATDARI